VCRVFSACGRLCDVCFVLRDWRRASGSRAQYSSADLQGALCHVSCAQAPQTHEVAGACAAPQRIAMSDSAKA